MRIYVCCVVVTVIVVSCIIDNTDTYNIDSSIDLLQWAPLRLKLKPYITFLNHFYYNTWRTRHPMTMEEEELRHLRLPKGERFAVACGACYKRSSSGTNASPTNLTIQFTGTGFENGTGFQYMPKMRRSSGGGEVQKYHINYLTCLLSYAITEPLQRNYNGRITCALNRGAHRSTDTISFSTVDDVGVDETMGEAVIHNTGDGGRKVELNCSTTTTNNNNPLVYVWYYEDFTTSTKSKLIPSLSPSITLPYPRYFMLLVTLVSIYLFFTYW